MQKSSLREIILEQEKDRQEFDAGIPRIALGARIVSVVSICAINPTVSSIKNIPEKNI